MENLTSEQARVLQGTASLETQNEQLREALLEAVQLARTFNRGGITWMEYDRELARLRRIGMSKP
jgi:hypothetical protein